MIIRILTEGQREIADSEVEQLNVLDTTLTAALESTDAGSDQIWHTALIEMLAYVRTHGTALPDDDLRPSDAVLPEEDASAEDVRMLLSDDGLIPG